MKSMPVRSMDNVTYSKDSTGIRCSSVSGWVPCALRWLHILSHKIFQYTRNSQHLIDTLLDLRFAPGSQLWKHSRIVHRFRNCIHKCLPDKCANIIPSGRYWSDKPQGSDEPDGQTNRIDKSTNIYTTIPYLFWSSSESDAWNGDDCMDTCITIRLREITRALRTNHERSSQYLARNDSNMIVNTFGWVTHCSWVYLLSTDNILLVHQMTIARSFWKDMYV